MKPIFIAIATFIVAGCGYLHANSQTPQLGIATKDGAFTHIQLSNGVNISHNIVDSVPMMNMELNTGKTITFNLPQIDSVMFVHPTIPVLAFTFPDYPEAEQVWTKDEYITANLIIEGNGVVEDATDLQLKVKNRGNSTSNFQKKPMRLKFDKKTSICDFKKSKNYVLLANYIDPTHSKNAIALWLAKKLETPYTNSFLPVDVFINGKYTGLYLLTEKVGINSTSVDIDETQGILFELDNTFDENYKFYSATYDLPVMVKDPDFDELFEDDPTGLTPEDRLALWAEDFNKAEKLAYEGKGEEVFDMESFINYLIVNNVVRNNEIAIPKSLYIHKKDLAPESKYTFGPVWDFDACYNLYTLNDDGSYHEASWEYPIALNSFLLALTNTQKFKDLYKERFEWFLESIYPEMLDFIDFYTETIRQSAILDGFRWNESEDFEWAARVNSKEHVTEIINLKNWLIKRVNFLKDRLEKGLY